MSVSAIVMIQPTASKNRPLTRGPSKRLSLDSSITKTRMIGSSKP